MNDLLFLKDLVEKVVNKKPEVILVYLFGSSVRQRFKKDSDIDMAFLIDRTIYRKDTFRAFALAQITGAIVAEIIKKPVDVSLLNDASLFFAYEVITTGECIYERDHGERILYEIAIKGQYYDFRPFIQALRRKKMDLISKMVEKA